MRELKGLILFIIIWLAASYIIWLIVNTEPVLKILSHFWPTRIIFGL